MENEQTLQPSTETTENPVMKRIAVKETGDSVNQYSQSQEIKTEEVDEAGNSTNSQIIDRREILANLVEESDEIASSPIDNDLEPDHGLPETPNHSLHDQIVPNSVGRSPSIIPDVDPEAGGQDPPQSPRWIMEAIDCSVAILAFVLEVAQIMSNNNKPLKWVVLGFTVVSCLITWTMFALNARQKNARFSFGCFILPDGQIYESIYKYIESYAAIIQVILSIISNIVKFSMRLTFGEIMISSAMIYSKLTMRYTQE